MKWLVTGGVGFIGTNLVDVLKEAGDEVILVDDLSRQGVTANKRFLADKWGQAVIEIDVADENLVAEVFRQEGPFDSIAHLAGQVSLVASIEDPRRDFAVNALGTLNILESARAYSPSSLVIGMSSNKVYGDLGQVTILERETRFIAPEYPEGFDESMPLDFHGPYGCSKGTADQYLLDYHRIYGLNTVSIRQSSVYGPFQHPRSDQGWVGFLLAEALAGRHIQLNGVGKQVRDLLHASDLAKFSLCLPALGRWRAGHSMLVEDHNNHYQFWNSLNGCGPMLISRLSTQLVNYDLQIGESLLQTHER